jgi:hypothetical protein
MQASKARADSAAAAHPVSGDHSSVEVQDAVWRDSHAPAQRTVALAPVVHVPEHADGHGVALLCRCIQRHAEVRIAMVACKSMRGAPRVDEVSSRHHNVLLLLYILVLVLDIACRAYLQQPSNPRRRCQSLSFPAHCGRCVPRRPQHGPAAVPQSFPPPSALTPLQT